MHSSKVRPAIAAVVAYGAGVSDVCLALASQGTRVACCHSAKELLGRSPAEPEPFELSKTDRKMAAFAPRGISGRLLA